MTLLETGQELFELDAEAAQQEWEKLTSMARMMMGRTGVEVIPIHDEQAGDYTLIRFND